MTERRPRTKGSFGAQLDELVTQLATPEVRQLRAPETPSRAAELREKIDIHALLFRHAWPVEDEGGRGGWS